MENITIHIKGREATRQAAKLMRTIHKAMASMSNGRCHISVSTSREPDYEEIQDFDLDKLNRVGRNEGNITYIGMRR